MKLKERHDGRVIDVPVRTATVSKCLTSWNRDTRKIQLVPRSRGSLLFVFIEKRKKKEKS